MKRVFSLKRKKIGYIFVSVSLVFIIYQIAIFIQLTEVPTTKIEVMRGTHIKQAQFYSRSELGTFQCIESMETIDFTKVNDDYCDCLDGSDEPGTNACGNGVFFCENQETNKIFVKSVRSPKVNDGICDCCDGSDEWKNSRLLYNFKRIDQKRLIYFTLLAQTCVSLNGRNG